MHLEVLGKSQKKLLPLLREFDKDFGLVGGTAMALQIGHRKSIDFDLFTGGKLDIRGIRKTIRKWGKIEKVLVESRDELRVVVGGVKLTFYQYPFKIKFTRKWKGVIKMPGLVILAAMKAYALGRRAKWKDYVDLYYVFEEEALKRVLRMAKKIFGSEFSEKQFREQLVYFQDVDMSEKVNYLDKNAPSDSQVREGLKKVAF